MDLLKRIIFLCCLNLLMVNNQAQVNDSLSIDDFLDLSLEDLLSIKIVSAGKKEQEIQMIPASVVVITRQDIERFGYASLQEALNQVPGLYLWDGYHVRGRINIGIRGYTSSDNVIILVNGVNQVEGVYNEYLLTKVAVPIEAIDRIEIVRGPMSVLYGSGAFFGVINIITNDISSKTKNLASILYGSNNTQKIMAQASIISEELKLGVTGSTYKTDGLDIPYSSMMSDPSQLSNWGLEENSTTKGALKDKRTYFNINSEYKGFIVDMSHSEVERGGFLVQPTVDYSPSKRHSTNFMTSYEYSINKKITLKGKLSYLNTNSMSHYFLNEKNSFLTFGYNSDAYEIEALSFIKPVSSLDITLGLHHRNIFYATNPAEMDAVWGIPYGNSLTRLQIGSRMIENAAYTQINYSPTKKLSIVAGFRLQYMLPYKYEASGGASLISTGRLRYTDTYEPQKFYFIPSISLLYSLSNTQVIKLLYGDALRNPPLGKMSDILYAMSNNTQVEYPQLIPSKIKTYEINYSGLFKSKFSVGISLFYNDLSNLISQYTLGITDSTVVYYTSNKGKISTYGTEVSLTFEPASNFNINVSAMYQVSENNTDRLEKVEVPYSPEYTGYMRASYTIIPQITAYTTGQMVGPMYPDYDYQTQSWLGMKTDPIAVFGAGLLLRNIVIKGLELNFKISNIFNTEIHYPATTLNQFADKGIVGHPCRFFIIMGYKF